MVGDKGLSSPNSDFLKHKYVGANATFFTIHILYISTTHALVLIEAFELVGCVTQCPHLMVGDKGLSSPNSDFLEHKYVGTNATVFIIHILYISTTHALVLIEAFELVGCVTQCPHLMAGDKGLSSPNSDFLDTSGS
ncbi:hypothetical protein J6590_104691 [Homalodisca vitripennis]|nr:hypothetical protein J6590_104691 [Homalodisca vitripennis]